MTRGVRRATTDDVWSVHEIARESWHAAYDDLFGSERVDEIVDDWYAIGDLESAIDQASGRDDAAFLIAERDHGDGAVDRFQSPCCGFAHAVPWPRDSSTAYLARLYVSPDVWRKGIGTALLERLEARLGRVFDRLRGAVLADNDVGVSFSESSTFHRVAVQETDLADGLEEIVYEKSL